MTFVRSGLKAGLSRVGLLGAARLARRLGDRDQRTRYVDERRGLGRLRERLGDGLAKAPCRAERTVLAVGLGGVSEVLLHAPLITAFRRAGFRPVVVLHGRDPIVEGAYRAIGVRRFAFLEDFNPRRVSPPIVAPTTTLESLLGLTYDGVTVGRYAVSRLMRNLRDGDPDVSGACAVATRAALADACASAAVVRSLVADIRPDAALFLDHGYSPEGQLFDVALDSGAPCYTWNAAHRDGTLMLKRYVAENRNVHPSSLSLESWRSIKAMRWTEAHWNALYHEIESCYRTGQWYGEVGTQIAKRFPAPEALKAELGLDPAKKTAAIFPHIFWDATFFWGTDLFRNYKDWFVASLKGACVNDRLNWVIKVHPGNLVKDRRDGFAGEHSEIVAIREAVGALPPHVRLIDARADIGTLALYHVIDACVTVRGTVGIEAAALGKHVITAGTGRFDRLGFTEDPDTAAAYLAALADIERRPAPDAARVELARRYAYGVLIARPTELQSIRFAYSRDASATLDVAPKADGAAFWDASDVVAMAEWIRSGAEDFLRAEAVGVAEPKIAARAM